MKPQNKNKLEYEFVADPKRDDGGGHVVITARTPEAKASLIQSYELFKGDVLKRAQAVMSADPLIHDYHVDDVQGNGRSIFEASACADISFSTPYVIEFRKRTGYEGVLLPDMSKNDLRPYSDTFRVQSHLLTEFFIKDGILCVDRMDVAYGDSVGRQKRTAREQADHMAGYILKLTFGATTHEPEFVGAGNGYYMQNPRYGTQRPYTPAAKCEWLFEALIDWWLDNKANDRQREIVKANAAIAAKSHQKVSDLHRLGGYANGLITCYEPYTFFKFDEFIEIK